MPISPERLPGELHYTIWLTELHGVNARVARCDHAFGGHMQHAEDLSADEIELLRQLHTEIRDQDVTETPVPVQLMWRD